MAEKTLLTVKRTTDGRLVWDVNDLSYLSTRGYVADVETVREALRVLEQQHKPNVFEYSIFGGASGTTKIGDFTQKKLKGW